MQEATPGNGFEIVCAVSGHDVGFEYSDIFLTDYEAALMKCLTEIGNSKEIACKRCKKTLVLCLMYQENIGTKIVMEEKCTA